MRYKITIIVEPDLNTELVGVKEDFSAYCEKFGDVKSVRVEPIEAEQMKMKLFVRQMHWRISFLLSAVVFVC